LCVYAVLREAIYEAVEGQKNGIQKQVYRLTNKRLHNNQEKYKILKINNQKVLKSYIK
jgi:hypothetical protein